MPGYSKGDSFWLNTEVPEEFIQSRAKEIYDYAAQNTYLKGIISSYTPNNKKIRELYMQILSGYYDYTMTEPLSALYELGDISKPT